MNNSFVHHPGDGLLLRFIDGELPSRKSRQIHKHLEACWQCRTEVEEIKSTMAECIRYRKNVLAAHLPDPPNAWQDLSRGFARIDDSVSAESFFARILCVFQNGRTAASLRWSLAAAAGIALICGVYYQLRETPSVQAATLLKRAVAATATMSARPVHRVRFRTGSQPQFIRTVAVGTLSNPAPAPLPQVMEAKFESAHYDSANPLSARAFQAWRDAQAGEQDEVSTVADPQAPSGNCYRIHTTTATGDVASATLMLRTTDLVPVEGMLQFRDNDWIEFSEFSGSPDRSSDANTASAVEVPERPAVPPSRLAVVPPRPSVSVSDELQVLSALHQIGADLGDPIHVNLTSDQVIVSGEGVDPQRRQLIQRTLETMPNVAVQFTEPVAAPIPNGISSAVPAASGNARASAPNSVSAPNSKIQNRLEEQLGGRAEFERFVSRILDVNEAVVSRALALHNLAQQFPVTAESGLSAADRQVLLGIAREHIRAMSANLNSLQRAITPVLTSAGGSGTRRTAAPVSAWQPEADELALASRRAQVLISVLLGVAPGQSSAELPSDVLGAISELKTDLDRCQQLLAQEGGG